MKKSGGLPWMNTATKVSFQNHMWKRFVLFTYTWRGAWNKAPSDFWWSAKFSFQFSLCMFVKQRENLSLDQESLRALFHAPLHFWVDQFNFKEGYGFVKLCFNFFWIISPFSFVVIKLLIFLKLFLLACRYSASASGISSPSLNTSGRNWLKKVNAAASYFSNSWK